MKLTNYKSLLLFLSAFICTQFVYSQEGQDSLFSASVVAIEEAEINNYLGLGDILSRMPGILIRDIGAVGQWSSCRIGGSNPNQVLILLDGHPLSDPWSGIHNLNSIPVEMIKKIEIFPSLNPFGFNPIGGVVNIVSRSNPSKRPYTKIVYRSGKNNFSDLDVTFGEKLTRNLEIFSGALLEKYGEYLPDEKYNGQKIRSKITWSLSPAWNFQYTILHNKSDRDIPYSLQMPGDTLYLTSPHLKNSRYDHTFRTTFNLGRIKNSLQLEHTSFSYEIRERNFSIRKIFPVTTTAFSARQEFGKKDLSFSWGIRTQKQTIKIPDSLRFSNTVTQGFFQSNFLLYRGIKALPQIHLHISPDGKVRFFLGNQLSWNPLSVLNIWATYSGTIRDPSMGERFGYPFYPTPPVSLNSLLMKSFQNAVLPNPSLKPETGRTLEIGIKWKWWNSFQATARGYVRTTKNLIRGILTKEGGIFTNQDRESFHGAELQFKIGPWWGFRIEAGFNLLKATDDTGNTLLERPGLWGNNSLWWEHAFFKEDLLVDLCLSNHYWNGFWNLTGETLKNFYFSYISPGSIVNFKASFIFIQRARFTFAVDNIFETKTSVVSQFPLPKKITRIGFSWELFD